MKTFLAMIFSTLLVLAAPVRADHDGGEGHACHRPDKMQKADTNKDGSIDKAEAQAMHDKHFSGMDKDSDGKLSREEVAACHHKKHKH
jgi:hypothetical protein